MKLPEFDKKKNKNCGAKKKNWNRQNVMSNITKKRWMLREKNNVKRLRPVVQVS